ncbi:MAG: hypothetical protein IT285_16255 [Bdellovibrionales bacterium]|nr:hypothetical protein [Bdellovibrionales bacterium]
MSVRRQNNLVSQQRLDVPQLRAIESSVASDFDELLRGLAIGDAGGFVLKGLEISMAGAVGGAASGLSLLVADSCVWHGSSSEAGTFFVIPQGTPAEVLSAATNPRVQGAFVSSAINYVGLEYVREADDATAGQVYIWDPTTKDETTKTLPLARTLDYRVVVTTSVWADNVLPIATVTTDASNNVQSVEDRRPMLFRLGTAGRSTPDPFHKYPWTAHSEGRAENPPSSSSSVSPFRGGDKMLATLKDMFDAFATEFLEIKGTPYWYSPGGGGSLAGLRWDLGLTVFTGQGVISHHAVTAGRMNWSQDVVARVVGSSLAYKILANAATTHVVLSDDQVAYLSLVRGVDVVPNLVFTNGSAVVSSVGSVSWTSGLQADDYVKLGSADDSGYYRILSVDSLSQVTLATTYAGASTGAPGAKAKYAWGVYQTSAAPSTDRHVRIAARGSVPFDPDTLWLFLRSDNGGATPRVYANITGTEIQQGDDVEVGDGFSTDILTYIGSSGESDNAPAYSTKLGALVAEVTQVTLPAAASITSGQSFYLSAADDRALHYVWFNKDGAGIGPVHPGRRPIEVGISTGDTANQVAAAVQTAIDAEADFSATVLANVVTVTNAAAGPATDAANVDVGGAFSVSTTVQGTGQPNNYVADAENLTLAAKRLDEAVGDESDARQALAAASRQDRVAKLIGGGTWEWDLGAEELNWSADAYLQIPGLDDEANTIPVSESPVEIGANEVAYVEVNRYGGHEGELQVQVSPVSSFVPSDHKFVIARRDGNDILVGTSSFRLVDGESTLLDASVSDQLLSFVGASDRADAAPAYAVAVPHTLRYIAEGTDLEEGVARLDDQLDKLFGQLRLRRTSDGASKRIVITPAEVALLDGTTLGQEIDDQYLKCDGFQIDLETGNYYAYGDGSLAGSGALIGSLFAPASFTSPALYRWYSICLTASTANPDGSVSVVPVIEAGTDGASAAAATKPQFSDKKLGLVLVEAPGTGSTINVIPQSSVIQLGTGSGGGGGRYKQATIADNQSSPANVTGFLVDSDRSKAFSAEYSIRRRHLSGGTEDTAFYTNLGTGFGSTVLAVVLQSDGKIVVGGSFTSLNGNTRNRLVRLNSDGTEDTAFYTNLGTGFSGGGGVVDHAIVQSDGKALVGGDYTSLNGNTRNRLVRLEENTDLAVQGTVRGLYRRDFLRWDLGGEVSFGDDAGVELSMTSAGQLQYTSTDLVGTLVESYIRLLINRL